MADEKPVETKGKEGGGEVGKIKLGEAEYAPEDLQGMVALASKVKEFEEKSGTDFDGLTSEFGKRAQTIGELRKKLEERKAKAIEKKLATGKKLSQKELDRQARIEAKRLGLVTEKSLKEMFDKMATQREAGRDLLRKCGKLEKKEDGTKGKPAFKTKDMLDYMAESGIRNPQDAYDLKFKKELAKWREEQLSKRRPGGLVTEETSTAGGKEPKRVKPTKDNLAQLVREELYGKGGV